MLKKLKRRIFGKPVSPVDGDRVVVIHNHLFKNAGSTIDWALHRNFGKGFVDHRDDKGMLQGAKYLGAYLQSHPYIRALSTHHLRFPLPELPNLRLPVLTMLRHPIKRVYSVYQFERNQPDSQTPGARFAREHSFREYVEWRLSPSVGPTIRNFQTRAVLPVSISLLQPTCSAHLEQAKENLQAMPMIGLVEMFDQSLVLFEQYLMKHFDSIDLSYVPQNVSKVSQSAKTDTMVLMEDELGTPLMNELLEHNALDIDLYAFAKKLVEQRIAEVDGFDELLNDIRQRSWELN